MRLAVDHGLRAGAHVVAAIDQQEARCQAANAGLARRNQTRSDDRFAQAAHGLHGAKASRADLVGVVGLLDAVGGAIPGAVLEQCFVAKRVVDDAAVKQHGIVVLRQRQPQLRQRVQFFVGFGVFRVFRVAFDPRAGRRAQPGFGLRVPIGQGGDALLFLFGELPVVHRRVLRHPRGGDPVVTRCFGDDSGRERRATHIEGVAEGQAGVQALLEAAGYEVAEDAFGQPAEGAGRGVFAGELPRQ